MCIRDRNHLVSLQGLLVFETALHRQVNGVIIVRPRCQRAIQNDLLGCDPVSYTHLDVYKRQVDQSALTGESLPAERKSGEAVFSGSIIRRGEIGGLVYACLLYTSRCV